MRKLPTLPLFVILLCGFIMGCGSEDPTGPLYINVQAYNIPPNAVRLESRAGLLFVPLTESMTELSFDLRKTPPANPGRFSFVLNLQPWPGMRWFWLLKVFVLSIAAFDASDCLVGVGVNQLQLGNILPEVNTAALGVAIRQFPAADCAGTRDLILHDVTLASSGFCGDFCVPSSSPLPQCFCINGWGFHPTSQLLLNGEIVRNESLQWTSAVSIIVNRLNRSGRLRIVNPNGETAELANVSFE